MGARLYNPTTGRFTSLDPVPGGNENAYNYPNDPINMFDLNGQWGCGWCHRTLSVVHSVASNSWFQSAVTVAACSTGWGCGVALYGFTALNAWDRHRTQGFGRKFWAGTIADLAMTRSPARNLRRFRMHPRHSLHPLVRANWRAFHRAARRRLLRHNVYWGAASGAIGWARNKYLRY